MEKYEKQSYEPIRLAVTNSGMRGMNGEPASLAENDLIAQNLLYLAYREPVTEAELSRAIGVPAAYVEPIIKRLVDGELMRRVGNKVYTDFIITSAAERERHIPAQKQLVSENPDLFLRSFLKGLEQIRSMDFFGHLTLNQRSSLELYFAFNFFDHGIYNVFSKIYNAKQVFPDRPNGGKWIAFGHVFLSDDDRRDYPEQVKHGYAGERHVYIENYLSTKSASFHVYDPEGFAVNRYFCREGKFVIDDDNLLKLLCLIESGVNPAETGFNMELLKVVPWLAECGILNWGDGETIVNIPIVSSDIWKALQEILRSGQKDYIDDIFELLKDFLKGKKQEIPKHLTSVPLQKQYMLSHNALVMATIRSAIKNGWLNVGNFDEDKNDSRCPYPMIFVTDR